MLWLEDFSERLAVLVTDGQTWAKLEERKCTLEMVLHFRELGSIYAFLLLKVGMRDPLHISTSKASIQLPPVRS